MVGERVDGHVELRVGGDADVTRAEGAAHGIFRGVVGRHKERVKIAAARASRVVHADLAGSVRATNQSAGGRKGLKINGFAEAVGVELAAVGGALNFDVERGDVMVGEVNRLGVDGVHPLAVISRDEGGDGIGSTNRGAAVSGVGGRDAGSERQARHGQIGDIRR